MSYNMNRFKFLIPTVLCVSFLAVSTKGFAQEQSPQHATVQTVKGRVLDDISEQPLVGIAVVVNKSGYLTTYTDVDGYYAIPNVPVGKISVLYSCMGYENVYMENVDLNSGKELVLNVVMREDVMAVDEVVITSERDKLRPVNDMASVSARTFSVADAQRYAGSMNDISRMAQNFAGVGTPNDSSNDISVRGNSPFGLLWRLEGIDIYNPNHFADGGATGGAISMLNVNSLSNSDFYSSAFPAEYMNGYSGVFDIKLREGNYDKHEFTGQVGINGVEVGLEGPFSKKSKASYMISYRYSFLGVLAYLGFDFGTGSAVPRYQDWTVKINIPSGQKGTFSIFSIGGFGKIHIQNGESDFYNYADDMNNKSNMAVVGVQYQRPIGHNQSLKLSLAASTSNFSALIDTLNPTTLLMDRNQDALLQREFITLQGAHNWKINSKLSMRSGLVGKYLAYKFVSNDYSETTYPKDVHEIGNTFQTQAYSELSYRPTQWFTVDAGVNGQFLFLNQTWNIDPRVGLTFKVNRKHEFSVGYGLHSQYQGLETYMTKMWTQSVDAKIYPNKKLDMTRAHHGVIGYQWRISPSTRLKTEAYYQYLFNLPIDLNEPYYAIINLSGLDFDKYGRVYVSEGTGRNYGLELTFERFLSDSWYYMATVSLFDSKFSTYDYRDMNKRITYNTRYNSNFVSNLLIGREFKLTKTNTARNIWSVGGDIKFAFAGGQRYIPIDLEASREQGYAVYLYDQAYESQLPFYMRADFKAWFKVNQRSVTHELGVEVRNFTNRDNIYSFRYDATKGDMSYTYQTGLLPLGYYRITF